MSAIDIMSGHRYAAVVARPRRELERAEVVDLLGAGRKWGRRSTGNAQSCALRPLASSWQGRPMIHHLAGHEHLVALCERPRRLRIAAENEDRRCRGWSDPGTSPES